VALLNGQKMKWITHTNAFERAAQLASGYSIWEYAMEALGLSYDESDQLFMFTNSLDEIRQLIIDWTGVDPHLSEEELSNA
jgi:hypothetical protein